jgi:glycerol-3-phosphate dehydrogenase (NAD(P)+)
MNKITILGAGAFGFAMAKLISENHLEKEIYLFDVNSEFVSHIKEKRKHPVFHGETKLLQHVVATTDLKEAVMGADVVILAIPSKFLRDAVKDFKQYLKQDVILLNLAKGLEVKTNKRVSEILDEELLESDVGHRVCSLSGGMIAREVTLGNPLSADLACNEAGLAGQLAEMLWGDNMRIETTDDLVGAELSGAFKNVVAIGAGVFDGLGYGESSKSAFISSAAKEVRELATALGAHEDTFGPGGQAWMGDLMTTCFGKSRNRELGELIGKGVAVDEAVKTQVKMNKSVEGFLTAEVVHNLAKVNAVRTPILDGVYRVLYEKEEPTLFVKRFVQRE